MTSKRGYTTRPFSPQRRMIAAASSVNRTFNTIHAITEVDISGLRARLRELRASSGGKLSLTACVVAALARAVARHAELNSFRRGGRLVLLDDVTVNLLVERDFGGETAPESLVIHAAQDKSAAEIHKEIRGAQARPARRHGELSGAWWLRLIPPFLMKGFIRAAARSTVMARRYGKIGVTAVGMFGGEAPLWFLPLSGATVTVTVGTIVPRPVMAGGAVEEREHLCLTVSFDHDIVDGAPAARFMKTFAGVLAEGEFLEGTGGPDRAGASHAAAEEML